MNTKIYLIITFILCQISFAQKQESIAANKLSEVVVTGQLEPQSIKKSVFNVRVISKDDIKQLAANNLSDVLNQYLNIRVQNSGSDGRSTVSMFGLDAQYFKILVDNIPLVSDTGMGTNVDLTQVNLDDVERIEIIEGSMGVTHGANAVSGILNIITKKEAFNKWEISTTAQEETVGKEYAFFDKGRYLQSIKIAHNFDKNWYVNLGGNHNDFRGFLDEKKGKDYGLNNGLRGYNWLPKDQLVGNAMIGFKKTKFSFFYKFDFYKETVHYYNPVLNPEDNYPFPETYYTKDKRFFTNRFYHHLNSNGKLFSKLNYNLSLSHQKQEREQEKFNYQIETKVESKNNKATYQSKEVLYSTGTLSNFFDTKKVDFQLGYEIINEKGFYDASAGTFYDVLLQSKNIEKTLENYDFFTAAEINFSDRLSVRPGLRYSFQSAFENQTASSLGLRYIIKEGLETRISIGKSYRTPNFDELYTYMVDSNHNIQGNSELTPEKSTSYEISLKRNCLLKSGGQIANAISFTFLDVADRIDMVLTQVTPSMSYKYLNINRYKMFNISTTEQFKYKNWIAKLGATLVGVSQKLDLAALNISSEETFLYTLQLNSSISYNISKWNTLFALYYKYNGKQQQFVAGSDQNGQAKFYLNKIDPYSWMDASVRKTFFKNKLEVSTGARNLLDIKSVQLTQNGGTGGVHSSNSTDLLLGYGRSYYLKFAYNLNFN